MTIICRTPDELLAALNRLTDEVIEPAVVSAVRQIAEFYVITWNAGTFTWSRGQPNKVWSGQAMESLRASIGSPDQTYAPDNPGPWPNHPHPYEGRSPFEVLDALSGLKAYDTVWLSSNAPHMADVERHTMVGHMAAEFTKSHFASGYSWGNSLIPSDIPF